ncbi:MAG TPA: LLM class flavin-dependent oxidoreductase, partial [Micromonosporaceae bacterium]
ADPAGDRRAHGHDAVTVGLGLYTGQLPPGADPPHYRDAIALAEAAESAGFDAFWVSEHHGFPDGYLPSPLTLLAAIASRTSRITLGAGLVIAPLAHPIRLAEEVAVVDQLSDGRLVLGLGLGYADHEYRAFGVERGSRGANLTDLVAFLRTAWRGETFDWAGPCYTGTGVRVTPVPVGGQRIPIWLGGYAEAAVRRAADVADGYLLGRADEPIVADVDRLLSSRRDPTDDSFTVALNVLTIGTDSAYGEASARTGLAYQQNAYEAIQSGGVAHAGRVTVSSSAVQPSDVDRYLQAYGSTDELTAQITGIVARLRHWARLHVVIRALFPEQHTDVQLRRIAELGRSVVPAIRATG